MNKDFATLVFKGRRFDGGVMPLDVLPELAAYQNLVLSAARFLYGLQNPERQRIEKGFEDRFHLVMKDIQDGSAVPNLIRVYGQSAAEMGIPATDLFGEPTVPEVDVFDQARDLVEALIRGEEIPDEFLDGRVASDAARKSLFEKFNGFGKTLSRDEYVLIGLPGNREGVRYDHSKRLNILLKVNNKYEDRVDLEGIVTKVDKDGNQIGIRLDDGRKIDVRIPPLFMESAIESLKADQRVRVQGTGLFDETGKLLQVPLVTDLLPEGQAEGRRGCRLTVAEQLAGLAQLPQGWFLPGSPAFAPRDIEYARELLEGLLESGFPVPWIYPTPEGEVRAEWEGNGWEWILEIDKPGGKAKAYAVHLEGDDSAEEEIGLDGPSAALRLSLFLSRHGLSGD